ncbi:hypothetical protein SAMN05920897_1232 [Alkalispirochaeta americana]|uniref:PilZ domain-containing protein n=1 Tax=Alkalispirochaeta americana TaxID=159291 RepID=A0A1N6XDB7_9SPIO|nr:hypothetical protein [Alkalispirochaeta americana]SIR00257.1 hypothetical protein SAMN05920897_1232 [Alkalispirochaeta americana]
MTVMLVSESAELRPYIQESLSHRDTDVICYDNPIKAMDNLEEIEPQIVLFSATDYPRHWKPFIAYLRNTFSRRETVFILTVNNSFDDAEAEKAEYLQVNAIITEALSNEETAQRLRGIVTRYYQSLDVRSAARYMPSRDDSIRCIFTNPYTFRLVCCEIIDISSGGLLARPILPEETSRIDTYAIITAASLLLGAQIASIKMKVVRVSDSIAFEYVDMPLDTEQMISSYLSERMPPLS